MERNVLIIYIVKTDQKTKQIRWPFCDLAQTISIEMQRKYSQLLFITPFTLYLL